jgi:hypothetical protein
MRKLILILSFFIIAGQTIYAQDISTIAANIGRNYSFVTKSSNNEEFFWIIGDSFAQGSNNTTGAGPDATGHGYYFRTSDNTIQPITTTDIPGAVNGSPWPQFCNEYFASTGTKAVIIPNGIGGTKFFDSWNGTSATYLTAKQDAIDAMAVAGVNKLRGIIIICGVNDARGGDNIAAIGASVGNLFYQLDIDFPKTQIYVVMLGHSSTNGNRLPQVRGYVREQIARYTNAQIVCQLQAMHEWSGGYYGVDDLHLNQTGNNLLGTMINRYIQLPTTYSKYARAIANSFYSTLSLSRLAAIDQWITTLGNQYNDIVAYYKTKVPDENDLYVDWGLCNPLVDNGYVFSANNFITTNTGQTIRMNISANNSTYRWTGTDLGIGAATYDRKGAFGGTGKYLIGTSSGSNVLGLAETAAGVMQYFAYDLGTASTGTGGFADNTEYAVDRVGTTKSRVVNGSVTHTETIAALTPLTSAPEIGGRNTSGVTLELNTEIAYFWWYKASAWNRATFYSANQTLESQW